MTEDRRYDEAMAWAGDVLRRRFGAVSWQVESGGGDASFRRYFRLTLAGPPYSVLLMDAPPPRENCRPFVRIAQRMGSHGVPAPAVLAAELEVGYLLLEDFGDALYLPALLRSREEGGTLQRGEAGLLYDRALQALQRIQRLPVGGLPDYDRAALRGEMTLCSEWFCGRLLGCELTTAQQSLLEDLFRRLEDRALTQPRVFMHRDYHSRNLMIRRGVTRDLPGVIDFQDAVCGPVTYDLVSLLRDCYITWPDDEVRSRALGYLEDLRTQGSVPVEYETQRFMTDFDWMGLQRHIKVLGIFSRLYLRDGKPGYLGDLPVVMDYVRRVSGAYEELMPFHDWFVRDLMPRAQQRIEALTP